MKIALIAALAVVVLWTAWGYFSSKVEKPNYKVLEKTNGYEVREYEPLIVAETTVAGDYRESLNQGFTIIAGYIFGDNTTKQKISMTAPVTEQVDVSEKISMTAPVTASLEGESRTIAFVMPSEYTLETLPTPNDERVKLREVPARKMAVKKFSWLRTEKRVEKAKAELLLELESNGVEAVGVPQYAGYNAPWTPPWMIRNEVMVEIK